MANESATKLALTRSTFGRRRTRPRERWELVEARKKAGYSRKIDVSSTAPAPSGHARNRLRFGGRYNHAAPRGASREGFAQGPCARPGGWTARKVFYEFSEIAFRTTKPADKPADS